MGLVRKVLANEPLKDVTMERVRVEKFEESLCKDWKWVNLVFLSQNYLWKLSTFCGYKGYLYWSEKSMRKVIFFITEWICDLASWLDWVMSPSCELTEWPNWTFCPVVLQLAWRFSFFACFTCVHLLLACKSWASREIQPRVLTSLHSFKHFFTLSHTLFLHDSHLNTWLLIAKIQANLARNKANKIVD